MAVVAITKSVKKTNTVLMPTNISSTPALKTSPCMRRVYPFGSLDEMAHPAGFEPAIPSFVDWCLIQFGHGCEWARILIDCYIIWQSSKRSTLVESHEKKFHGWRLLGVIFLVVVALAAVSFALDVMVVGPLEGR